MIVLAAVAVLGGVATDGQATEKLACKSLLLAYLSNSNAGTSASRTLSWVPGKKPRTATQGLPSAVWFTNELDLGGDSRRGIPRYQPSTPGLAPTDEVDLSVLRQQLLLPTLAVRSFAGRISETEYLITVVVPPEKTWFEQRIDYRELDQGVVVWNSVEHVGHLVTALNQKWEALFSIGAERKVLVRTSGRFGILSLTTNLVEVVTNGDLVKFSAEAESGVVVSRDSNDKAGLFVLSEKGLTSLGKVPSVGGVTKNQPSQRSAVAISPEGNSFAFVTEVPPLREGIRKKMSLRIYSTMTSRLVRKPFYFWVVQERLASLTIPRIAWFQDGIAVADDGYLAFVRSGHLVQYLRSDQNAPEYISCLA